MKDDKKNGRSIGGPRALAKRVDNDFILIRRRPIKLSLGSVWAIFGGDGLLDRDCCYFRSHDSLSSPDESGMLASLS